MQVAVAKTPAASLTFTGKVYISAADFSVLFPDEGRKHFILLGDAEGRQLAFSCSANDRVAPGTVALNAMQRTSAGVSWTVGMGLSLSVIEAPELASKVKLRAQSLKSGSRSAPLSAQELTNKFVQTFGDQMVFRGAQMALKIGRETLKITVLDFEVLDLGAGDAPAGAAAGGDAYACMGKNPDVVWDTQGDSVDITGKTSSSTLFDSSFDFGKLGIGGLSSEFSVIFRRAFAPRLFNADVIRQLGIKHIRGMLLYGPPGCGKTLIARKIGEVLNAREPKIVNGPEVISHYQGKSEEAVRELFQDAEREQEERGDASELHIIIFDEFDALAKKRGSTSGGTGTADNIVNQLLTKLDGVKSLNNILVIGMTNRKDMVDEALLRPGRLELHVEIGLPDQAGRLQILKIHTKAMRESGRMAEEAVRFLPELAERTKNFSGAELEGLVRAAAQYALRRGVETDDAGGSRSLMLDAVVVTVADLERALEYDVSPAFGSTGAELGAYFPNGVVDYGGAFRALEQKVSGAFLQLQRSSRSPLLSLLLHGEPKTGKTALMCKLAQASGVPFVRMVTAEDLVGQGEAARVQTVLRAFEDSYKSAVSVVLLDDVERLLEYVRIGPRFSNAVLQALLVLLKKLPPAGHRLLVVATTSALADLEALGLASAFDMLTTVPRLGDPREVQSVLEELPDLETPPGEDLATVAAQAISPIGIKQLIMVVERAKSLHTAGKLTANGFADALVDAAL